jgi:Flp pilus assembly protein TadG
MSVTAVVARLWRDIAGTALVEYTLAFPLFALVALGALELSYMFSQWAMANKAAYIGARTAVVSDPVASNIVDTDFLFTANQLGSNIGEACLNAADGSVSNCPSTSFSVTCTSTACTLCQSCTVPNSTAVTFSATAFTNTDGTGIFDRMKSIYPNLQPTNVTVTYQVNGAGFIGMPGGLPLNVTVSIVGMTHQFFFSPGFLRYFGVTLPTSWPIPSFSSTLTSECMQTAPTDPPTC